MASSASPHPTHGRGSLREALTKRVVVADGAMGTMLQAADPSLDDFQGHEGCNEILNVTRPELVASVHDAYFSVGRRLRRDQHVRRQPRPTWGSTRIPERIYELAEAGARDRPPGRRRLVDPRPPPLGAGLDRPGNQAAQPRPCALTPCSATPTSSRSPGSSPAARTRPHRDRAGPAAGQGGHRRGAKRALAEAGVDAADLRPGDRRDHRARCCSARRSAPP